MDITALTELVKKHFPESIGYILTGSQRNNAVFKTDSDIDVVVVNPFFCDLCVRTLQQGAYTVDFTIIPLINIEEVVENETYDTRGSLVSMLQYGNIIMDTDDIVANVCRRVLELSCYIHYKTLVEYDRLMTELIRMPKLFRRQLTATEKTIFLCELVTYITSLESIVASHSLHARHSKFFIVSQSKPALQNELARLVSKALNQTDGDLKFVSSFAQAYIEQLPPMKMNATKWREEFYIDFFVPDFSLEKFVTVFLPSMMQSGLLADGYRFFYLSNRKYARIYRHTVTICFSQKTEPADRIKIITELETVFSQIYKRDFIHSVVYLYKQFSDDTLAQMAETIRVQCSRSLANHIRQGKNEAGLIHLTAALCAYTCRHLQLGAEDFTKLNFMLLQKNVVSRQKQDQATSLSELIQCRQETFDQLYSIYNATLQTTGYSFDEECMVSLYKPIDEFVMSANGKHYFIQPYEQAILKLFKIQSVREASIYRCLAELFLEMICNERQRNIVLYYLTKKQQPEEVMYETNLF